MKFTAFLLLVACFQVSANGYGQTLSLNFQHAPLRQLFTAIEKQTGYSFVYGEEQLQKTGAVSVNLKNVSLETALSEVFRDQPLTYSLDGKYIILRRRAASSPVTEISALPLPPAEVHGRVLSDKGEPLEGISIMVRGGGATETKTDGRFSINVPDGKHTLLITGIGFEPKTIEIGGRQDIGDVTMVIVNTKLNEMVVTGYTSQRKKDITGAVDVVNVADLTSTPATNVTGQLQGRASGVTVVDDNLPGNNSKVRIRGFGSFANNDPLYLVDNVPTTDISSLNPNDIESMQVLKDAASASVYGSRASNGVIIITTKRGKAGAAKVSYDFYYGSQNPGKGPKNFLNPQENADLTWLAMKNSGLTPSSPLYGNGPTPVLPDYLLAGTKSPAMEGDPATNPDLYEFSEVKLADPNYKPYLIVKANKQGTNWFEAITRNAPIMSHNLSVSGAAEKSRYLLSLNYYDQDPILVNTFFRRYTLRLNTEFNVKKVIRIGENLQVYNSSNNISGSNSANGNNSESAAMGAMIDAPILPVYDIKGNFAGGGGTLIGGTSNPVASSVRQKNNRYNRLNLFGNVYAEADLFKHLTVRTSFGGTYQYDDSYQYPYLEYEGSLNVRNTRYSEYYTKSNSWTWTNLLNYKNNFGKHAVNVVAGTEAVEDNGRGASASIADYFVYTNLNYITLNTGQNSPQVSGSPFTVSSLYSLFGKLDYSYDNKYLASVTVRRDGSSKFGSATRYGVFPSASLGWRLSDESFMKNITWVDDLKVRGSYGMMGGQNISPANQYTYFAQAPGNSYYDINGTGNSSQQGFYLYFAGNKNGKWETNITTNLGFDATLFNNKTEMVFDYYVKKTKDLLFQVEQPAAGGSTASQNPPAFNVGDMQNKGIDIGITQRGDIGGKNGVHFDVGLTFTTYKNLITKIADSVPYFDANSPLNEVNRLGAPFTRNAVGHPISSFFGYKVLGLFQNAQDVANSPTQQDAAPGRFKYLDANHDGKITPDDRVFLGDPNPKFTLGLNINLSYKGFDLGMFFYGAFKKDAINYQRWITDFYAVNPNLRVKSKAALYDSWTPQRTNTNVPIEEVSAGSGFSTTNTFNSYLQEHAGYFRMKNLQIGYTIPHTIIDKVKIDRLRVYVQATNLFTITKYTGLDPEIISYSESAAGIDLNTYPTVRQYIVGLNVNF